MLEFIIYLLVALAVLLSLVFIWCSLKLSSEITLDEELQNFIKQREEIINEGTSEERTITTNSR